MKEQNAEYLGQVDELNKLNKELEGLTKLRRVLPAHSKRKDKGFDILRAIESLKREINFTKTYGKQRSGCICKLWRKSCNNGKACFMGSWFHDHSHVHVDDDGRVTFIGEPYRDELTSEEAELLDWLSKKYNLSIKVDADQSSWYPGATTAVIMQQTGKEK